MLRLLEGRTSDRSAGAPSRPMTSQRSLGQQAWTAETRNPTSGRITQQRAKRKAKQGPASWRHQGRSLKPSHLTAAESAAVPFREDRNFGRQKSEGLDAAWQWFYAFFKFSRPHTMLGTFVSIISVSLLAMVRFLTSVAASGCQKSFIVEMCAGMRLIWQSTNILH